VPDRTFRGTKTSTPVDYPTAKQTYDKLVREKMAKGYTAGENGTPYQNTEHAKCTTGILPQLLNPVETAEVDLLIDSDDWIMQEKYDGRRLLLQKEGAAIHGINRKGLVVGLPSPILVQAHQIATNFILDGECVGDVLYAFDLLQLGETSLLMQPYEDRLDRLSTLLDSVPLSHLELVETAFQSAHKRTLLEKLRRERREGAVFKRLDAPYTPGRPNSGGSQLKHKFTATLSAVVAKLNQQRSVELRLIGKSGWGTAGNVTIPANQSIPQIGDVVEVRYLYAFPESGVLYQPVYLSRRTDIDAAECMVTQLKFKPTEEE